MVKVPKVGTRALVFSIVLVLFATSTIGAYIFIKNSRRIDNTVKGASVEKPKFVTLQIFKPGVMVKTINSSEFVQAIEGQELLEGTTIKTDSEGQAEIVFTNGGSTRVDVNSEVTLSTYQQTPFNSTLTLGIGRIWSRVAKLLGNESYQTKSKDVVATVRGTSYGHHVLPTGEDNMIVTKGEILSDCENGNQTAVIQKDQWGTFDCSENAPKMGAIDDSVKDSWFNLNLLEDQKIEDLYGADNFDDFGDN